MNKFQELISQEKPVLVDFFAEWCGLCKMQAPILQDLKKNIGDVASIVKIDIDKNQAVASQFGIRSVPTLMILKNGEVKWKQSGVFQADELERLIKQNL
ncbi:thioredoxin [Chryseobacterium vrystaatense]|uniref:Thioredoxin n=1 Tax=Chryseobacterium vrystaatense TaxID=307480 RepID=A0ABR4UPL4_9FLAO|nr:thioredoxin [Chryseobacterium vrystaatense]KFF27057.1 thioredoxin [Chryseobacterium vrystaatense]